MTARMTRWVGLAGIVVASVGATVSLAQTTREVEQAVNDLAHDDSGVREQATQFLWGAGRRAESALRDAAESGIPEQAARARAILNRFRYGISPDAPDEILQRVQQIKEPRTPNERMQAISALSGGDGGLAGPLVLLHLAGSEKDAELRALIVSRLRASDLRFVRAAIIVGDWALVEQLLETLTQRGNQDATIAALAAYYRVRGTLGAAIEQAQAVAAAPTARPQDFQRLFALQFAAGDYAGAGRTAARTRPEDKVAVAWKMKDFTTLIEECDARINAQEGDIDDIGFAAAYGVLSGDAEKAKQTLERLRDAAPRGSWNTAKALFLLGHASDAMKVAASGGDTLQVAELLEAQCRYKEAIALVADRPPKPQPGQSDDGLSALLREARLRHYVGEWQASVDCLNAAAARREKGQHTTDELVELAGAAEALGLRDRAVEFLIAAAAREENGWPSALFEKLLPGRGNHAVVWWQYLRNKEPNDRKRFDRVADILEGKAPADQIEALTVGVAESSPPAAQANGWARHMWLTAAAETAMIYKKPAAAEKVLAKAIAPPDSYSGGAMLKLGDLAGEAGQWDRAASWYERAWRHDGNPMGMLRYGWSLTKAGQQRDGKEAIYRAQVLALGDLSARWELAKELRKLGLRDEAIANEQLLLSTEAPGAWEGNEWHQAMAEDAKSRGDHAEAAHHIFMSMIRVFSSFTYFTYTPAYLRVPADQHAELARVALKAGDMKAVRREMEAVLESLPGDTRFVISFAPELRAAGCGPEADWLFDRVFDYLSGVAKEYPKCCEVRNFAAWMGAVCHRRLDESLAMAEQIVKEQPSAAHYIDTLAEVCFSRRDADRAISLMKRCIELDPSRDRHRKQLKRFEARDFDSPPLPTND